MSNIYSEFNKNCIASDDEIKRLLSDTENIEIEEFDNLRVITDKKTGKKIYFMENKNE